MNKEIIKSIATLSAGFSAVLAVMVIAVAFVAVGLAIAALLFPFVALIIVVLYLFFAEKTIKVANELSDAMGFEAKP